MPQLDEYLATAEICRREENRNHTSSALSGKVLSAYRRIGKSEKLERAKEGQLRSMGRR